MNQYLKAFAENQPITQVINAVRALMLGVPVGNYAWAAVLWSLGILIVSIPIAAILFRRKTAQ